MKQKHINYGPIFVLVGAALWSTNAPFFKILQVDSYLAIFIRAAIAGLLLLPTLRFKEIKWDKYLFTMLISYVALCVGVVLAIRNTSANIATGMQYTAPLLLFLISWMQHKVTPSLHKHWPLLLLLIGLIVSMCSKSNGVTLTGNLFALSTAISFTAMTVSSKKATEGNPLGMVSLTNLFCAIVVFLFFLPDDLDRHLSAISPIEWIILVYLGVFQIASGYALYYLGLKTTEPAQASMLAPCEMVLGPLWVAIFVKEYPDWIGIFGSLLIVAGVIGEVIVNRKTTPSVPSGPSASTDTVLPEAGATASGHPNKKHIDQ